MSQDSESAKNAGGSQLNPCTREVPNLHPDGRIGESDLYGAVKSSSVAHFRVLMLPSYFMEFYG